MASLTLNTTTLHKTVRVRKVIVIMNEVNFIVWFFLCESGQDEPDLVLIDRGYIDLFRRQLLFKGRKYFLN